MNDLLSADNNLAASEVPYDAVCFHCQQAAEKLLKAFLVAHGEDPPRTHDLLALLEKVLLLNDTVEQLQDALSILRPYAVATRYPDEWFTLSLEDAREARDAAAEVVKWLDAVLEEIIPGQSNSG